MKAMMNAVTAKESFCNEMVDRSTTMVLNSVASAANREANMELVWLVSSKNPISFLNNAAMVDHTTCFVQSKNR